MSRLLETLFPIGLSIASQLINVPIPVGISARAVGIDGYHRPNSEIRRLDLSLFKGRPETFSTSVFLDDLKRLKGMAPEVRLPAYDRPNHEPVAEAITIGQLVKLVLVEGILLYTPTFGGGALFDFTIWLEMSEQTARKRVNCRKVAGGRSHADVEKHYDRVDGPNHRDMLSSCERCHAVLVFHEASEEWLPETRVLPVETS